MVRTPTPTSSQSVNLAVTPAMVDAVQTVLDDLGIEMEEADIRRLLTAALQAKFGG